MKIINIKDIIKEEISQNDRLKTAVLKAKWQDIFNEFTDEITVDYIKNGILYVKVKNSIIKHYMYTNKNKILEKINNNIEFIIDDIQIKVK